MIRATARPTLRDFVASEIEVHAAIPSKAECVSMLAGGSALTRAGEGADSPVAVGASARPGSAALPAAFGSLV